MEPTGASWGTIPFPPGFLQRLRDITRKHGVVLIFDEVITGFRYAPGGAQATIRRHARSDDAGEDPRGRAAGRRGRRQCGHHESAHLPGRSGMEPPQEVSHPGTYNANPLSAVAGVTALNILSDPAQQEYAANLAARLRAGFNRVLVHEEVPGFAYGESSLFHLVLGTPLPGGTPDGDLTMPQGIAPETLKAGIPHRLNDPLYAGMMAEGVEVFHGGGLLSIAHTEADVDRTIEAFDTTIRRMLGEGLFE